MGVFHSSQFTFMTRNQAAQPPNIVVDTKSGGDSAPDLVSKSVVAFQANFRFFSSVLTPAKALAISACIPTSQR